MRPRGTKGPFACEASVQKRLESLSADRERYDAEARFKYWTDGVRDQIGKSGIGTHGMGLKGNPKETNWRIFVPNFEKHPNECGAQKAMGLKELEPPQEYPIRHTHTHKSFFWSPALRLRPGSGSGPARLRLGSCSSPLSQHFAHTLVKWLFQKVKTTCMLDGLKKQQSRCFFDPA